MEDLSVHAQFSITTVCVLILYSHLNNDCETKDPVGLKFGSAFFFWLKNKFLLPGDLLSLTVSSFHNETDNGKTLPTLGPLLSV